MRKLLVALAVLVLALMAGQYGAQETHAQGTVDYSIGVVADGCETGTGDTTCDVDMGTTFTVSVNLNSFSGFGSYGAVQARLNESAGLTYQDRPNVGEVVWPDSLIPLDDESGLPGSYLVSGTMLMPPFISTYTGVVIEVDYQCSATPSSQSVTMVAGTSSDTLIVDEVNNLVMDPDGNETLTINCVDPRTVDFSIGVVADGCETGTGDTTCNVDVGTQFTVSVNLNSFSGLPGSGTYGAVEARLNESAGLTYQDRPGVGEIAGVWPDCDIFADYEGDLPGSYNVGCVMFFAASTYTGVVIEVDYTCSATPSSETVTMVAGTGNDTLIVDEQITFVIDPDGNETLTINCAEPAPPPTPGPPGIGGIVEVASDGDAPAEASGSSSNNYLPIAALIAGSIVAVAAGGWYARRRWVR